MSEVLQNQDVIKLYEENHNKPELEEVVAHYGVLGMKWGHRKSKYKIGLGRARKKWKFKTSRGKIKKAKKEKYASKEDAIKAKDIKYISKHRNEYTTEELNRVMNRVNAEQRISQMAYDQKTTTKIKKSIPFKMIMGATIGGLTYATVNFFMGDKSSRSGKKYAMDFAKGALVGGAANILPGAAVGDLSRLKKG